MEMLLADYKFWLLTIVVVALVYEVFIRPRIEWHLTADQLDAIDEAVWSAVDYVDTVYDIEDKKERERLALEYAFKYIEERKIVPARYLKLIRKFVMDKVTKEMETLELVKKEFENYTAAQG